MGRFDDLPKEIALDILVRLPTESILESKMVCKPWRDLLRQPSFSKLHFNHHHLDSGKSNFIFLSDEQEGDMEVYFSEYDENCHEAPFHRYTRMNLRLPFNNCSITGSCNGLICFNVWARGHFTDGPGYICNPVTREYIILPKVEVFYTWSGFGYVPSTNEYKAFRINLCKTISNADMGKGIFQVYTLGSVKGWRSVGTIDVKMRSFEQCAGVFANGALHWVDDVGTVILAFSLADEKVTYLPPPPTCFPRVADPSFDTQLGVLGDCLSATYYPNANCTEIWLLKKNNDNNNLSWRKEFRFNSHIWCLVELTKSGRLLCYEPQTRKICSYDSKTSSAKMDVSFGKSIFKAIPHENTLVSLKVLGEKDTKTMESGES